MSKNKIFSSKKNPLSKTLTKTFNNKITVKYPTKYNSIICPNNKCKKIPLINFDNKNPEVIRIKCIYCKLSKKILINDYLKILPELDHNFPKLKCGIHKKNFDKFCIKCKKQFCSGCAIHKNHISFDILNTITEEKMKNKKNNLDTIKKDFKFYIEKILNENLSKIPEENHYLLTKNFLKPFIQKNVELLNFFESILLNYDFNNINYFQQLNAITIFPIIQKNLSLWKSTNRDMNIYEILNYKKNNILIHLNIEKYSLYNESDLKVSKDCCSERTIKTSFLYEDKLVLVFKNGDIEINDMNLNILFPTINTYLDFGESYYVPYLAITNDKIIIAWDKILEVFDIQSSKLELSENLDLIRGLSNVDDENFLCFTDDKIIIYNINDYGKKKLINWKGKKIFNFIKLKNKNVLAALIRKQLLFLNSKNFEVQTKISLINEYNKISEFNEKYLILSGDSIIYFFDLEKFNEIKLYDIRKSSCIFFENIIDFTNFQIFNYFNLICKKTKTSKSYLYKEAFDDCIRFDEVIWFKFNEDYSILKEIKKLGGGDIYFSNCIIINVSEYGASIYDNCL